MRASAKVFWLTERDEEAVDSPVARHVASVAVDARAFASITSNAPVASKFASTEPADFEPAALKTSPVHWASARILKNSSIAAKAASLSISAGLETMTESTANRESAPADEPETTCGALAIDLGPGAGTGPDGGGGTGAGATLGDDRLDTPTLEGATGVIAYTEVVPVNAAVLTAEVREVLAGVVGGLEGGLTHTTEATTI